MAITLNHTIVPAHDKAAAAKFFAEIFGVKRSRTGHFAPVRVNKQLTLLFELDDGKLNDWGGGRGFYFRDPNGHVLELMTVPQ
jgi:catechol 2,3-dioxygenase-like lactoylglutathione lyase family enzyme